MIMESFDRQSSRNKEKKKFQFTKNGSNNCNISDFHTKFLIHPLTIYIKDENNIPESVSW